MSKFVCIYHIKEQILRKKFEISCNLSLDAMEVSRCAGSPLHGPTGSQDPSVDQVCCGGARLLLRTAWPCPLPSSRSGSAGSGVGPLGRLALAWVHCSGPIAGQGLLCGPEARPS